MNSARPNVEPLAGEGSSTRVVLRCQRVWGNGVISIKRRGLALLASSAVATFAAAGGARANELTWSYVTASVGTCVTGSCGPGGFTPLHRATDQDTNTDFLNASVQKSDYSAITSADYGVAWASAQPGDGALDL